MRSPHRKQRITSSDQALSMCNDIIQNRGRLDTAFCSDCKLIENNWTWLKIYFYIQLLFCIFQESVLAMKLSDRTERTGSKSLFSLPLLFSPIMFSFVTMSWFSYGVGQIYIHVKSKMTSPSPKKEYSTFFSENTCFIIDTLFGMKDWQYFMDEQTNC